MNAFLLYANLILLGLLAWAGYRLWLYRGWMRWAKSEIGVLETPIATIDLPKLDPLFHVNELGPTLAAEVHMLGGTVLGGTTDKEAWILAVLAKRAVRMFEFGTATGRTTYHWAKNSSAEASVTTLTLAPDQRSSYQAAAGDQPRARINALSESRSSLFYYSATPEQRKITQLFGDSKQLDVSPLTSQFDLIFIDGSHAHSYVKNDTEMAFRMIRGGGLIIWHDYAPGSNTGDVYRYLNQLSKSIPLRRIHGTTLVCYRVPRE